MDGCRRYCRKLFLDCRTFEKMKALWSLKCLELLTEQHSITSQKMQIHSLQIDFIWTLGRFTEIQVPSICVWSIEEYKFMCHVHQVLQVDRYSVDIFFFLICMFQLIFWIGRNNMTCVKYVCIMLEWLYFILVRYSEWLFLFHLKIVFSSYTKHLLHLI